MVNNLKEYRWGKKLSQAQLAIKSGVSESVIKRLEGDRNYGTSMERGLKLAKALDADPRDIFII